MCGITGFIARRHDCTERSRELLRAMTAKLSHRGPDASGYWESSDGLVHLGHRRLSVLDLSATGAQPIVSATGKYALTFNGEIYNYRELRSELIAYGSVFRGTSDTEVLVAAIERWGVEDALRRLNGMFAFACWDNVSKHLWLARDRLGEKPLYYSTQDGVVMFGSELKSLIAHSAFRKEVDAEALSAYVRFNYIPAPFCILSGVKHLPPGSYLCIRLDRPVGEPRQYWALAEEIRQREMIDLDPRDPMLRDMIDADLRRAVRLRLSSDVPLGAFLSGGIDSSLIVALMQAQSSRPIKTFTIGFWENAYNEANDAARVARHLGTEHHEFYLSSRDCTDIIPTLADVYDEPFADSSQIPTALVAQLTRRHVTVALSGDGGDELWGGYNRYSWMFRLWPKIRQLPLPARARVSRLLQSRSPRWWDAAFSRLNRVIPGRFRVRGAGDKVYKFAMAMGETTSDGVYGDLISQWKSPSDVLIEARHPRVLVDQYELIPENIHFIERMMYLDTLSYLPGDILCKVDRASMACGLEVRVPFLDPCHLKLAWRIPVQEKFHNGLGKWPLREVLKSYLPEKLFDRPKLGFGIPIGDWLRGPLRDWSEEMLSEKRISSTGYFKVKAVRRQWSEHISGRLNREHSLWTILMFQAWHRRYFG